MNEYLEAKIIGIKPEASYMGSIYEQTVEIELPSGIQMGLFDSLPKVTSGLLGKSKNLVVLAFLPSVEKISETTLGIKPFSNNPLDWKNHSFHGRVERIGVEDKWHEGEFKYKGLILLDVGEGHILVNLNSEELEKLEEGDFIKVIASRTDLLSIN